MEKRTGFLQEFSKQHMREKRDAAAGEIKAVRQERRAVLEREQKLRELREGLEALRKQMEGYDKIYKKILDFKEYLKIKSSLSIAEVAYSEAESQEVPLTFKSVHGIVERLNRQMVSEWVKAPYAKEEAQQLFSAEYLATLNEQEYVLLLKRFPSSMVTHVTRQGVRDHWGGVGHSASLGNFSNGFEQIMEQRRLQSHLAHKFTADSNSQSLAKLCGAGPDVPREIAIKRLQEMTDPDSQHFDGSAADLLSIHAATEEVANAQYGAENGNEIFFAYPSMHIASQYKFTGNLDKAAGGTHNNRWIVADDEGLAVDAAMVFIPADAKVSPRTGSRYELNQEMRPEPNKAILEAVMSLAHMPGFADYLADARAVFGERDDKIQPEDRERLRNRILELVPGGYEELKTVLGTYEGVDLLQSALAEQDEQQKLLKIKEFMWYTGLNYKLASNPVSSKEYWQKYFERHPEKKPVRVVYYEGGNPTRALNNWKNSNGLLKHSGNEHMGFEENVLDLRAPDANNPYFNVQKDRFADLARQAIDEYYENLPPQQALAA